MPPSSPSRPSLLARVLKSVAAYEFYKRQYTHIEPEKVAELLLLDARHPRSVRFNLSILQSSLYAISGAVPGSEGGRVVVRPSVKAQAQTRRRRLAPNKAPAAATGKPGAAGKPAPKPAGKPDKK